MVFSSPQNFALTRTSGMFRPEIQLNWGKVRRIQGPRIIRSWCNFQRQTDNKVVEIDRYT